MTVRLPLVIIPVLAFVSTVVFLTWTPVARRPQVASGTDVLSVLIGDAKTVLSAALVHKADSYFHGGIDMHCEGVSAGRLPDPWRWLNERIRAPEVERHLEGGRAVEMLPWFWASVKANPHNVEAWTATWYAAAHVMKDRSLAQRVLDEARRKNPDSPEIALTEGEFLYDRGRGDLLAAGAAFLRARELALKRAGGDAAKLDEADARVYSYAGTYLGKIRERGFLAP